MPPTAAAAVVAAKVRGGFGEMVDGGFCSFAFVEWWSFVSCGDMDDSCGGGGRMGAQRAMKAAKLSTGLPSGPRGLELMFSVVVEAGWLSRGVSSSTIGDNIWGGGVLMAGAVAVAVAVFLFFSLDGLSGTRRGAEEGLLLISSIGLINVFSQHALFCSCSCSVSSFAITTGLPPRCRQWLGKSQ